MTEQDFDTLVRRIEYLESQDEAKQKQIDSLITDNRTIRKSLYDANLQVAELQLWKLDHEAYHAADDALLRKRQLHIQALERQIRDLGPTPVPEPV